jgi:cyclomaltodextrin glucanotransferase
LVFLNKGAEREVEVEGLDFPDGRHPCILTSSVIEILDGKARITIPANGYRVFTLHERGVHSRSVVLVQLNGAPTNPGDRVLVIGDCGELGDWDLARGRELECVNANTWFGELPFDATCGKLVGYKFVIIPPGENKVPLRENRIVRRRVVIGKGMAKWRDHWES